MVSNEKGDRGERLWPRRSQIFSTENPTVKSSTAGRNYSGKAVGIAAGTGLIALSAFVFYPVRELLAAFLLFSVVFGVVAIAFLILWLVERGAHQASVYLEAHIGHIARQHVIASARVDAGHIVRRTQWI